MIAIRQVAARDARLFEGLCALLADTVEAGASVGFLAPLSRGAAERYWESVFASLGEHLCLWVAESDGRVVGTIQLAPAAKENAPHRAEVQKLLVLPSHRGRGIGSRLMAAAERFAQSVGRTVLVLDTEIGSHAETVYRHLGWQKAGAIPDYALTPDGRLHATVYYYKLLERRAPIAEPTAHAEAGTP